MKNQETEWLLKEKYHGEKTAGFFTDCERLAKGEPLAYVIGFIPFLDCTIWLDSRPLIPRPETEYWVERVIIATKTQEDGLVAESLGREQRDHPPVSSLAVLDLCAGSGAVGVAIARAIPNAHVTFAEIDPKHLPTIEKNLMINISTYAERSQDYKLVASDLFENISGRFDIIVTNPPYIDAEANTVDHAVVAHEPHLALFGGASGLEIITRIISQAPDYLAPKGQLWIEHEPFQSEDVASLAATYGFTALTQPDQYGTARYSILTKVMAH